MNDCLRVIKREEVYGFKLVLPVTRYPPPESIVTYLAYNKALLSTSRVFFRFFVVFFLSIMLATEISLAKARFTC